MDGPSNIFIVAASLARSLEEQVKRIKAIVSSVYHPILVEATSIPWGNLAQYFLFFCLFVSFSKLHRDNLPFHIVNVNFVRKVS